MLLNELLSTLRDPSQRSQLSIPKILLALRRGEPITAADFSTEFGLHEVIEEQKKLGWNNYLLGRWNPKWQTVQAQYFASISSQKTSRRWATAILHQFFMNAWDMWQYRNDRLHGPAGPLVLDQHRQVNLRIQEEMIAGCTDMHRPSWYLILKPTPCQSSNTWIFHQKSSA